MRKIEVGGEPAFQEKFQLQGARWAVTTDGTLLIDNDEGMTTAAFAKGSWSYVMFVD